MIDIERLRKAISHFEFSSKPSSATSDTPATVGDINKVIKNAAKLLDTFVDELENHR
ncbi:MAG: hypothetical protein J1E81_07585 [Eubacterium sp.]|nr:hypothetical protein [Eubacterium sp.]